MAETSYSKTWLGNVCHMYDLSSEQNAARAMHRAKSSLDLGLLETDRPRLLFFKCTSLLFVSPIVCIVNLAKI